MRSDYNRAEREECGCGNGTAVSGNPAPTVGDPVQLTYGAQTDRERDYSTADGRLAVDRFYYSLPEDAVEVMATSAIAGFGSRWHGVIPGRIDVGGWNASQLEYLTESGAHVTWHSVGNTPGEWTFNGTASNRRRISFLFPQTVDRPTFFWNQAPVANGPAEVRMDMSDGEYILFRRAGPAGPVDGIRYLVPIEHGYADGYTLWYDYPDTGEYPSTIRDSFSRQLQLTWVDADRTTMKDLNSIRPVKVLSAITVPDGSKINYTYGYDIEPSGSRIKNRLESVTHTTATGTMLWGRSYLYENAGIPYALTGKVDQLGRRLSTYTYDAAGLVASTERAGGVDRYTITNLEDSLGSTYRYVTNALGHQNDYTFHMTNRTFAVQAQYLTSIVGHAIGSVPATTRNFSIDGWAGDFHINSYTDKGLTQIDLVNDGLLRPTSITQAAGTSAARTQTLTWHPNLDLPTSEVKPGLTTSYTYSPEGRLLTRTLTDTTTQTVPYSTNGQTRTWTYSWTTGGRLASINGPKPLTAGVDDVTSFTYDASGNLTSSTNALNQVTSFAGYDANGRPSTMTDVNGIVTAFVYDGRGHVLSVTVKHPTDPAQDATTTFDYDVEGRVVGFTPPQTDKLIIGFDLAGRRIGIRNLAGDRIVYTVNAMGGVTNELTRSSDKTILRTVSRTFDALNHMLTETLGTNRTRSFEYDAAGNLTKVVSARNAATQSAFDPVNRLVSTLAPDAGTTAETYDQRDNLTAHTDAAAVQTIFVRNGFGEVIQEVSPDRGTSTYYYDVAGDLIASIDGRGQRIDIVRDVLGRILSKTPAGRPDSEVVRYGYDVTAGSYGIGRRYAAVEGSLMAAIGKTQITYDHRGNVLVKRRVIGTTVVAALAFTYDLADRIRTITYPSGRIVQYLRDTSGRVTSVTTQANASAPVVTLVSAASYAAFGSLVGATYGNGLTLAQSWGNDGRLASKRLYVTAGGTNLSSLTYDYDNDDNIISIADGVDPTRSVTYGYDPVGRLNQSVLAAGSVRRQDFVHDANGNRTRVEQRADPNDTNPASTATYTLNPGTNQLASVADGSGTRSIAYDARGNTIGETRPSMGITVGYDGYGRLTSYQTSGGDSLVNQYNGFDERITGGTAADPRHYVYDMDGRLMGEYGASYADVKAETIWLSPEVDTPALPIGGDDGVGGYAPLAVATSGGALYWVHGNHLGVPIVIADSSGNLAAPAGYTPAGFPGQTRTRADLYYNLYRDYDPTIGRYIQADPIGLKGGSNPYLYANGNPLKNTDPLGLLYAAPPRPGFSGATNASIGFAFIAIYVAPQVTKALHCAGASEDDGYQVRTDTTVVSGSDDYCEREWEDEQAYCADEFGVVAWQYGSCMDRARQNYEDCRDGRPHRGRWKDKDMGPDLPKPPRPGKRWR